MQGAHIAVRRSGYIQNSGELFTAKGFRRNLMITWLCVRNLFEHFLWCTADWTPKGWFLSVMNIAADHATPAFHYASLLWIIVFVEKNVPLKDRFFLQPLIPSFRLSECIFEKRYNLRKQSYKKRWYHIHVCLDHLCLMVAVKNMV
jgi:hypothetical protein